MSLNPAATIVARKLKQQGFTPAQIAGVLGNFQQESSFNPRINEGGAVGAPMGRGGYGLAQWTGDRQTSLINFAKKQKRDPGDPNLQADFLAHELSGPESRAADILRKAQSPEQAALVFRQHYERAGIPKDENRMGAARSLLPKVQKATEGIEFSAPSLPGERRQSVAEILRSAGVDVVDDQAEEAPSAKANSLVDAFKQMVLPSLIPSNPVLSPGIMNIMNPIQLQ